MESTYAHLLATQQRKQFHPNVGAVNTETLIIGSRVHSFVAKFEAG